MESQMHEVHEMSNDPFQPQKNSIIGYHVFPGFLCFFKSEVEKNQMTLSQCYEQVNRDSHTLYRMTHPVKNALKDFMDGKIDTSFHSLLMKRTLMETLAPEQILHFTTKKPFKQYQFINDFRRAEYQQATERLNSLKMLVQAKLSEKKNQFAKGHEEKIKPQAQPQ